VDRKKLGFQTERKNNSRFNGGLIYQVDVINSDHYPSVKGDILGQGRGLILALGMPMFTPPIPFEQRVGGSSPPTLTNESPSI